MDDRRMPHKVHGEHRFWCAGMDSGTLYSTGEVLEATVAHGHARCGTRQWERRREEEHRHAYCWHGDKNALRGPLTPEGVVGVSVR